MRVVPGSNVESAESVESFEYLEYCGVPWSTMEYVEYAEYAEYCGDRRVSRSTRSMWSTVAYSGVPCST